MPRSSHIGGRGRRSRLWEYGSCGAAGRRTSPPARSRRGARTNRNASRPLPPRSRGSSRPSITSERNSSARNTIATMRRSPGPRENRCAGSRSTPASRCRSARNALHDDGAAEQEAGLHRRHRDDGKDRVPQGMLEQHLAGGGPWPAPPGCSPPRALDPCPPASAAPAGASRTSPAPARHHKLRHSSEPEIGSACNCTPNSRISNSPVQYNSMACASVDKPGTVGPTSPLARPPP